MRVNGLTMDNVTAEQIKLWQEKGYKYLVRVTYDHNVFGPKDTILSVHKTEQAADREEKLMCGFGVADDLDIIQDILQDW